MGCITQVKDTNNNIQYILPGLTLQCTTAAATAAKTITGTMANNITAIPQDMTINVWFKYENTADYPTLNINNTGAIPIAATVDSALVRPTVSNGYSWPAGSLVSLTFVEVNSSTCWLINGVRTATDTKVTQTATTTNSGYPILFKNSANQTNETSSVRYAQQVGGNRVPSVNPSNGCIYGTGFNDIGIEYLSGGSAGIHIYDDDSGTALTIPDSADYTLGAACEKGVDASIPSSGWSATNVPTTAAVANYVASAVSGGNAFMGSLVASGGNASTTWTDAQVQAASYTKGQYWVCSAAGTYCGKVLEAGDMLFCVSDKSSAYSANDFSAVQNNIETLTTTEVSNLWTAAVAVS